MKTKAPVRRKSASKKQTYANVFASCVRESRLVPQYDKTVTVFADKSDSTYDVWSSTDKHHSIALGTRALLSVTTMPDGKQFAHVD
jgi:hypothetical protein